MYWIPEKIRKPAASTCPPSLVSASSSNRSSSTPTAQIMAPAMITMPASRKTKGALRRQERQLARDEVRRHEATEHGQATEVRDRLCVHVAVADGGDRAGPQRDLAGDHRQQVGDRGGDQEDEGVLTHGRPRPCSALVRQGRTEGLEHGVQVVEGQRAAAQHPPWLPVTSMIVEASLPGASPASTIT